jgi:hypothetical protein
MFKRDMIVNKNKLTQKLNSKYYNNPGFFDGVVDAINEFKICDYFGLYTYKDDIVRFLKAYHIEGFSVNQNGELVEGVYPFLKQDDVILALYAIGQYLI